MFVVRFWFGFPQKQPLSQGFKSKVCWKVQEIQGRVIQGRKAANERVFSETSFSVVMGAESCRETREWCDVCAFNLSQLRRTGPLRAHSLVPSCLWEGLFPGASIQAVQLWFPIGQPQGSKSWCYKEMVVATVEV